MRYRGSAVIVTSETPSRPRSSEARHAVDQRRFAVFDLLNGPPQGDTELTSVFDRTLGVPAHRAREAGEVDGGAAHVHADIGSLGRRAPHACHTNLVLPVVVVR